MYKKNKKFFSLFLSLIMVMTMMPCSFAETGGNETGAIGEMVTADQIENGAKVYLPLIKSSKVEYKDIIDGNLVFKMLDNEGTNQEDNKEGVFLLSMSYLEMMKFANYETKYDYNSSLVKSKCDDIYADLKNVGVTDNALIPISKEDHDEGYNQATLNDAYVFPLSIAEIKEYGVEEDLNLGSFTRAVTGSRAGSCKPGVLYPNKVGSDFFSHFVRFALNLKKETKFIRVDENEYKLNVDLKYLDDDGETELQVKHCVYGDNVQLLDDTRKHGAVIDYWHYAGETQPLSNITVKKNESVIAQWKACEYNIKADANGGTFNTGDKQNTSYMYGGEAFNPEDIFNNPTRTGYIIDGWIDKNNKKIKTIDDDNIENLCDVEYGTEATVYASWIPKMDFMKVTYQNKWEYKGVPIEPQVEIKYAGKELSPEEYNVSYSKNDKPGPGEIIITGKGEYEGQVLRREFIIDKPAVPTITGAGVQTVTTKSATLKWKAAKGTIDGYMVCNQNGKELKRITKLSSTTCKVAGLTPGKVYTFKIYGYKLYNNVPYTSAKAAVVKAVIKPEKVATPVVKTKSKTITVSWKKKTCTRYEVQIAVKSSFKGAKTVKTTKLSTVFKGLKKNTKYYVRVRAVNVSGKTVAGDWSKVKSIKCK